jgi:hypothetical protein
MASKNVEEGEIEEGSREGEKEYLYPPKARKLESQSDVRVIERQCVRL